MTSVVGPIGPVLGAQIPLAAVPAGSRCLIAGLAAPPADPLKHGRHGHGPVRARMAALGFVPGVSLTVEANYGSGPVIVNIKGARVAVGRGQASCLLVRPVASAPIAGAAGHFGHS